MPGVVDWCGKGTGIGAAAGSVAGDGLRARVCAGAAAGAQCAIWRPGMPVPDDAAAESDLLEVLLAAAEGRLGAAQLQWSPEKALTVRHPPRQTAPNKPGSSSRATGMPSVRVDCVSVLQMCALERCVSGVRSDDG